MKGGGKEKGGEGEIEKRCNWENGWGWIHAEMDTDIRICSTWIL